MGRGRQKAKQTKVARRLKYESPEPDLAALERELTGKGGGSGNSYGSDPYADDPYAKYAEPDYVDKWADYEDDADADEDDE
ncbi:MAG: DUF3073 domain-containing protein [Mobiluncus porci]|uniref:DUF3073 domain-containing protein n=1 Tax=Mobiluncus porci TaxID=2652278 RepID=UPI0023F490C5|nr:DUF3073 domain-containing protein [Mobiluncus porci]MDD7542135.1 DUF3073 domain-containing protein [Mobiluncus porci]MDY5748994.1 DUF3073 domain-containing protein [Mobiluncus porci]